MESCLVIIRPAFGKKKIEYLYIQYLVWQEIFQNFKGLRRFYAEIDALFVLVFVSQPIRPRCERKLSESSAFMDGFSNEESFMEYTNVRNECEWPCGLKQHAYPIDPKFSTAQFF